MAKVIGRTEMYPNSKPMRKADVIRTKVKNQVTGMDSFSTSASQRSGKINTRVKVFGR